MDVPIPQKASNEIGFLSMNKIKTIQANFNGPIYHFAAKFHGLHQNIAGDISIKYSEFRNPFCEKEICYKLLKFYADYGDLSSGKMVHGAMIRSGTDSHLIGANSLVNIYCKCHAVEHARYLFDKMNDRNVVSWGAIMAGYLHSGLPREVFSLFELMGTSELRPNHFVFATVISSCAQLRALDQGKQSHSFVLKSGLEFYPYVNNALVTMYSNCGATGEAKEVFESMRKKDTLSCNSLISGLLCSGHDKEAFDCFRTVVGDYRDWDHISCLTILNLCASVRDMRLGEQLHCMMVKKNLETNVYVTTSLIDMYGKCGMMDDAQKVFCYSKNRNVATWTAIMTSYLHAECYEEALRFFSQMGSKVQPNEFTYAVALNSCAELSSMHHGEQMHGHAWKAGYTSHQMVGNALINMYSKSGSIVDADKVFMAMVRKDTVSWNSMITGYAHHGLGSEALHIFQLMQCVGVVPNYVTFVGVLCACGHLALKDDGFYYLSHRMKELGITPGLEHYTCIIGLLGRIGELDEAKRIMSSVPIQWDIVAWRTLLSACLVHQNVGLGERVAEYIIQLYPEDTGTYVLLSNIYAKVRRWDHAIEVRRLMKENNVKKEPGVSWIQLRNKTHVFVSKDRKHMQWNEIYEKLEEVFVQIKLVGYAPDITSVLHDVEEEQKEEYLKYHSEKLAIAFGLMHTPRGAPIRVIKNLRVCEDCHNAAKFISNTTKREIILRDANRFHSFKEGVCSCGDFW
ncbi:pentatricopeptide repeat-containing protein At5g39680 [Amborella trichopoda]|uniref:pentatricopeptide repeat-containing protein At5g39680 n=1 Tax=Amborella trichopoda TaxID=13333 RepID=UPI0005D2FE5E|nr:pentatricopeptide repeat-containing protein At5g39680 [Amborella trichopoda]|eukprot:XP_011623351.1 pentatricopeptide repeat-containing protein At5g39680 [Amborella trichopoda]